MNDQKSLQIGDILIGEFEIIDVFGGEGKSGMGVVYLVEQRDFPLPIVLKTYQKNDLNSVERFRAEANTWISIGLHPNNVQAHFVREINEQLFIGAEYIAPDEIGRNAVTDYIELGGISDYIIIKWIAQFCYGMSYAISNGLKAHRDIKPDNLMVDEHGNLKVTDFGLAKAFYDFNFQGNVEITNPNPKLTAQGIFLGTLLYASPEQILDSSAVDLRSDIYSFGIVLYQLIALGGFPYLLKGKTTQEDIAIMHLQDPLIEINHPLFPLIKKCLAKLPDERYQSYEELLNDLKKVSNTLGIKLPLDTVIEDAEIRELYIKSLSHLELGNKEKALEFIDEYLKNDQIDSSAWQLKGRILADCGNFKEAINTTLKSYELDPYNSKTLNNLGIFYGEIGELDKGIAFLTEAIKVDGYNAGAVMNLAIACDKRGAYSAAADVILKALDLTPDKKDLHFNAGNIAASAMKNGLLDKAVQILEKLVSFVPEHSNYWFNLAIGYRAMNQKEKAIKCYETVLEKTPNDEQSFIYLVQLNAELANYEEGLRYCEIMLENDVAPFEAIAFKAQILQSQGYGRQAINFVKSILNSGHQNNDNLWTLLGNLFENDGLNAGALKCFRQAKSILNSRTNINEENLEFLNHKISRLEFLESHTPEQIMRMINQDIDEE